MSGILERIEAKLDQLLAVQGTPDQGTHYAPQPQANLLPPAQQPLQQPQANLGAQQANLLGGAPAAAQQPPAGYPPATQEMIVALVTPLVADPNTKALLQAEMHAMGVQALPDAQPHQWPELYARFQRVQAQVAAQQQQQPAAAPASII